MVREYSGGMSAVVTAVIRTPEHGRSQVRILSAEPNTQVPCGEFNGKRSPLGKEL